VIGASVPSLVPSGHTPDADLVYRALVTFGPAVAGDLAGELGMTTRRVTAALDELLSVAAVTRRRGASRDVVVWAAAPLDAVLSARHARRPAPPPRTPMDSLVRGAAVRHLPSRPLTRVRLAELNAVASQEHLAMHPEPAFDAEALRSATPMDRMLLRRGVRMRMLGIGPADPDPTAPQPREPAEPAPEYRSGPSMPMKLIIVDRRVALFPIEPGDLERGYLEVSQPPVVAALVNLFEEHWRTARDPWERLVPQNSLAPREHALIMLLAQGHTDTSAARQMHIGVRTVTTILRGLMDRFAVENRFQLGLVLGQIARREQQ